MNFRKVAILNFVFGFIILVVQILFIVTITYGKSRENGYHIFRGVGKAGNILAMASGILVAVFMIVAGLFLLIDLKHDQRTPDITKDKVIVARTRIVSSLSIVFGLLLIVNHLYIWIVMAINDDVNYLKKDEASMEHWKKTIQLILVPIQILLFLLSAFAISLNSILIAKAHELLLPSSALSTKSDTIISRHIEL